MIYALRALMAEHNLDAYLIPSADEHLNEYLPKARQRRQWVSGFTGSVGDFLVGRSSTWLFVDSRYYEQAEREVDSSLIQISKVGLEENKTLEETLEDLGREAIQNGTTFRLGYDPFTISVSQFQEFQKRLEPSAVVLVPVAENLVDVVLSRSTEPSLPYADSNLIYLPDAVTGEGISQKLGRVREAMQKAPADILLITKLDQIAWLFNLRGQDIPYNPVFIAYAIVTSDKTFLFTNQHRIEPQLRQLLEKHTLLLPYEQYAETLKSLLAPSSRVLLDPKHTTMGTYQILSDTSNQGNCQILLRANPIEGMKARKNAVELAQMQQANLKASRAKTRTLKWISDRQACINEIDELKVAKTVEGFYAEEADFFGLSFNTIAGSGTNSSIVHYGTPNPEARLQPGIFLLLDSGAQFTGGTTDDTRTIIIGDPTQSQIERYTEVLKAHITLAMQPFPKGTTGAQLDGIARSNLWHTGLDYGHGTGHGVGAFLNVHEGPNGISKHFSVPLEPGMVTSIEPGYYEPGWGGIRIENLYVVKDLSPENGSKWLGFESLTYIPFDKRLIDIHRLSTQQRNWLDQYNLAVVEKLTPTLDSTEATWLRDACRFL